MSPQAVIDFWFGDIRDGWIQDDRSPLWFQASQDDDKRIKKQFGELHAAATTNALDDWHEQPDGSLALIIVLDQFSRQLHRGTPQAFAHDAKALSLAMDGVARGYPQQLPLVCRQFYYLPWQHSESLERQKESLTLYQSLVNEARHPHHQKALQCAYAYSQQHYDIIAQFGRFPHRNAVLKRANTAREEAYLKRDDSPHFGQQPD